MYNKISLTALITLGLIACDSTSSDEKSLATEIQTQYASLAAATYDESLKSAKSLQAAILAFTNDPTDQNLESAKEAWLKSRVSYGQSEVFRFYGGPIDSETGPEGLINAWPLDEGHIDYVDGNLASGIINLSDDFPEINEQILAEANETPGETDISTGYHAIEFLLWGQDLSAPSEKLAGQRPVSDYTTADNADRRKEYLNTLASLLVDNLKEVSDAWTDSDSSFRKTWLDIPADSAIGLIILSMGSLSGGELAGERMDVALANGDQEDEHSCFSDNTHDDVINNAQGILNLWNGSLNVGDASLSGKGLKSLVEDLDSDLATQLDEQINNSVALAKEIPAPFDWAISFDNESGREKVKSTISSLQAQAESLGSLAEKLDLKLNF